MRFLVGVYKRHIQQQMVENADVFLKFRLLVIAIIFVTVVH